MGLIYWWSRLAALAPSAANFALRAPGLSAMIKAAGGIHRQRSFPPYAKETFRAWFDRRGVRKEGKRAVILFPDTFNNFFRPETAQAAVEVLEWLGYEVRIPPRILCCGRPLYDEGMLGQAKGLLGQIMDVLGPDAAAGTPIVGLEPACVATFRDELVNLFPKDDRAQNLARQTFILSEFLARDGVDMPELRGKATVHFHCNHHAILKPEVEREVLEGMGLDVEVLDSGCCGMAGSFGFEEEHFEVSIKCGERVLLPAVRAAAEDVLIIADGFSCREQIAQCTNRQSLHLSEVVRMAIREGGSYSAVARGDRVAAQVDA